jgi:hypothetical protein
VVRMLHLQVSSPIFHSDSITHSTIRIGVPKLFSIPKRQAASGLRAAGSIVFGTPILMVLQAAHCTTVRKCDKRRETPHKQRVNLP